MIIVVIKSLSCLMIVNTIYRFVHNTQTYNKKFWQQNQEILNNKKNNELFTNQFIFTPTEKNKSDDLSKMAYAALNDIT